MQVEIFKEQIERLRNNRNWATNFNDEKRLQLLRNRCHFLDPEVLQNAVTYLIAEKKFAPTDSEIADAVQRYKPKIKSVSRLGTSTGPYTHDLCRDSGAVILWNLSTETEISMRCSCTAGQSFPTSQPWTTYNSSMTKEGGGFSFDSPRVLKQRAAGE